MFGGKVMHCYYVHDVLTINYEIHCPGHGAEVETFDIGGVINRAIY